MFPNYLSFIFQVKKNAVESNVNFFKWTIVCKSLKMHKHSHTQKKKKKTVVRI